MRPLSEILVREACELVGVVVGVGVAASLVKLADRRTRRIRNERRGTDERPAERRPLIEIDHEALARAVAVESAGDDRGPGPRAA